MVLIVCSSKWIAESGHHVVELCGSKRNYLANWDVNPTADRQGKSLGRRGLGNTTPSYDWLAELRKNIAVKVGMRAAEEKAPKRMYVVRSYLELRAEQVRKHVALDVALQAIREGGICRDVKASRVARVALQIRPDAQVLVPVKHNGPAPAIQAVALRIANGGSITLVGVIDPYLRPRKLLSKRRRPQ